MTPPLPAAPSRRGYSRSDVFAPSAFPCVARVVACALAAPGGSSVDVPAALRSLTTGTPPPPTDAPPGPPGAPGPTAPPAWMRRLRSALDHSHEAGGCPVHALAVASTSEPAVTRTEHYLDRAVRTARALPDPAHLPPQYASGQFDPEGCRPRQYVLLHDATEGPGLEDVGGPAGLERAWREAFGDRPSAVLIVNSAASPPPRSPGKGPAGTHSAAHGRRLPPAADADGSDDDAAPFFLLEPRRSSPGVGVDVCVCVFFMCAV